MALIRKNETKEFDEGLLPDTKEIQNTQLNGLKNTEELNKEIDEKIKSIMKDDKIGFDTKKLMVKYVIYKSYYYHAVDFQKIVNLPELEIKLFIIDKYLINIKSLLLKVDSFTYDSINKKLDIVYKMLGEVCEIMDDYIDRLDDKKSGISI